MYRKVIIPDAPNYSIPIPHEWYGLPVEVTALPLPNTNNLHEDNAIAAVAKTKLSKKYRGVFSPEDAKSFNEHSQAIRNEWNGI